MPQIAKKPRSSYTGYSLVSAHGLQAAANQRIEREEMMPDGHSEKRLRHKDRKEHDHDGEMARMESAKKKFGPLDGGGKSFTERPHPDKKQHEDKAANMEVGDLTAIKSEAK